jgi:hypothetical protein
LKSQGSTLESQGSTLESRGSTLKSQGSSLKSLDRPRRAAAGRSGHLHRPEGQDSGRPRVFLRIGIGDASWIGSFEIGHMDLGTVSLMPYGKHLFVSAKGAGYIIDLKSPTLVEQIGTDVAGVMWDDLRMVFIVDHDGMSLEAFGGSGHLWKTDIISSEGFAICRAGSDQLACSG